MSRRIPSRVLGAPLLALALIVSFALPASATPASLVSPDPASVDAASLAAIEGAGHHFGFSQASVLAQATSNFTPPTGPTTGTVAGQVCNPSCTFGGGSPQPETASAVHVASSVISASTSAVAGTGVYAQTPSLFAFTNAAVAQPERLTNPGCNTITTGAGAAITCSGTSVGDVIAAPNAIVISYCGSAVAPPVGGVCANQINQVPTTITVTPGTNNLSPTGATATGALQAGGFVGTGGSCVGLQNQFGGIGGFGGNGLGVGFNPVGPIGGPGFGNPIGPIGGFGASNFGAAGGIGGINGFGQGGLGRTCPVTGAVNGSATVVSSAIWNINAVAPAGTTVGVAGVTPVAFALTTANTVTPGEGPFVCSAVAAVGATTTCNFTTAGNPLVGVTVAICFTTPGVGVGGVTCLFGTVGPAVGGNNIILPNLPILPPPPLEFIPPPPPPLLPPPPPAPTGALAAPRAAFPDVPVIPEADSLFLVVGGLVALGGLAGYRSLRRRRDDEAS